VPVVVSEAQDVAPRGDDQVESRVSIVPLPQRRERHRRCVDHELLGAGAPEVLEDEVDEVAAGDGDLAQADDGAPGLQQPK